MGWRWRRSENFGPFRVNASRSGIGTSWGVPGFRIGKNAHGHRYIVLGLPGTGLSWMKYLGGSTKLQNSAPRGTTAASTSPATTPPVGEPELDPQTKRKRPTLRLR
jgi:hypothetical protein